MIRDLCWLYKKAPLSGLYILPEGLSPWQNAVLEKEMNLLFTALQKGRRTEQAALIMRLTPTQETYGLFSAPENFSIVHTDCHEISAPSYNGLIYGLFALHRGLLTGSDFSRHYKNAPSQSIRMINHWDNFDGSIERGYAGDSIFYNNNSFRGDFDLIEEYARLLASVGVNAISINNVNVRTEEMDFVRGGKLAEVKKIADVFRRYGIRLFLAVNFAAPMIVGGTSAADVLCPNVAAWWRETAAGIYHEIPDFAGFIVKADSEGQPGPLSYGRGHDEGANALARALAPFGGVVVWRCFVYDCMQDWRNRKQDRAMTAYEIFKSLDGRFDDNVILQIKNGPIDFQIREPIAPLFGALNHTNQIIEFQITQEYTGHQIDLCHLTPLWKECLDYDTKYGEHTAVKRVIRNGSARPCFSGVAGVGNVGLDANWTGHKLAQSNLFGWARLAWDNDLTPEKIVREWIALSFDLPEAGAGKLAEMILTSRQTFEDYTCPLSVGFMCNPRGHYGPNVDGYEYDRWGTYHHADRDGVGRDRTLATGTGYTRQYSDARFAEYENMETCPDEYLLFFHHVPYNHVLHNNKTIIQHIYDTHFDGFEKVQAYITDWRTLQSEIDPEIFIHVLDRLARQLDNAREWRDQVNAYFFRKSGVSDRHGRVVF